MLYLGTVAEPTRGMMAEIKRRSEMAYGTIVGLRQLWRCRTINKKQLKKRIFNSLAISVLLYNAETWLLDRPAKNLLTRAYAKMVRNAFEADGRRKKVNGKWESHNNMIKRAGLEPRKRIIARRRTAWVAHVIRGDEPRMKKSLNASKKKCDKWWQEYRESLEEEFNLATEEVAELAKTPAALRGRLRKNDAIIAHSIRAADIQVDQEGV